MLKLYSRTPIFKASIRRLLFAFLLLFASLVATTQAETSSTLVEFENLQIHQRGTGKDVLFIPGLNSSYQVFEQVCESLQPGVRCHLIQLPGFAGAPPLESVEDGFLTPVAAQITRYIESQNLDHPILAGHSLGGFSALLIASQRPDLSGPLVIVDSLPYLAAAQNPAATPEQMRPIATSMKRGMLAASDDQYKQRLPMQLMGMTRDQEKLKLVTEWSITSDRATMAQAYFEMQLRDLRTDIEAIKVPAIIFGAWAAYEGYGTTKQITQQMFAAQYKNLANKRIRISDASYHFIMWDDQEWLVQHIHDFLNEPF